MRENQEAVNRLVRATGLLLCCVAGSSAVAQDPVTTPPTPPSNHAAIQQQAMAVAGDFAATLKPRLLAAMQQGGPSHAVTVCSEAAPDIANLLSAASGWTVKRVSLKPRNPMAAPDEFERKVLQQFDALVVAGQPPAAQFEIEGDEARLLVPQLAEALCLTCHGEPGPDVEAVLRERYPNDTATGYIAGQVRGAISLRRRLSDED